tara:strand:- start:21423 stop:21803 length:381 start_codon:yes stop_codon:yes gene_type:complete
MTLKATAFDAALDFKIIQQDDCVNTANVNVAGGPCRLLYFEIDNQGGAAPCFLRIFDGEAVTVGSTTPEMTFKCLAEDVSKVAIPNGKHFKNLTFWATRNATPTDNTAPSMSGSNKLLVTIIVQPD